MASATPLRLDDPVARRRPGRGGRALRTVARHALAVGALLALVWGWSDPALAGAIEGLRRLEAGNEPTARAIVSVGLVTAGALALVSAWSRATAPRRAVRLADGRGTIAIEEVERRLEELWLERGDVIAARATVENRHRHGIRVAARLAVTVDARLHETAAAAAAMTEWLVERQLGVSLATRPHFELRYRELDLRAGRAHDFRAARARPRDSGGEPAG